MALPVEYRSSYLLRNVKAALAGVVCIFVTTSFIHYVASPLVLAGLLFCLAVLELVFPILYRQKLQKWNQKLHEQVPHEHDGHAAFADFLKEAILTSKIYDKQINWLSRWFFGAPLSTVKKGNLADLLLYAFWFKTREQLEAEGHVDLADRVVEPFERLLGGPLQEGRNEAVEIMQHLWQPLQCTYRPAALYLVWELLSVYKHVMLTAAGFARVSSEKFDHYTCNLPGRGGDAAASRKVPLLFLHGVGVGLLPYIPYLNKLAALGHPVVAVDFYHLSMRWVDNVPAVGDVAEAVAKVVKHLALGPVCIVSHSYGTLIASNLFQSGALDVHSLCFIDPVCFNLFTGDLVANFVYRRTVHTGLLDRAVDFVSRDIHTAAAVSRNFYWTELNLFAERLPQRTVVVLSGADNLVPVASVLKMLKLIPFQGDLLHYPDKGHAGFLVDGAAQDAILTRLHHLLQQGSDDATQQDALQPPDDHDAVAAVLAASTAGVVDGSCKRKKAHDSVSSLELLALEEPLKKWN